MLIALICYDIQSDSKRRKLAKSLEREGYYRMQKSVFVGRHPLKFHQKTFNILKSFAEEEIDSLLFLPITSDSLKNMDKYGVENDFDKMAKPKKIVVF
jgi:CRISPR-associated endonuclease Cas2